MDFLQAIILGAVEGITEFLPISSTGHLILTSNILRIPQTEFVKSFEIAIQAGAILSVIVLYGKPVLARPGLAKQVAVAFIPTGIIGFVLYKFVKTFLLGNTNVVLLSLFWGGVALIAVEYFLKRRTTNDELQTKKQSAVTDKKFNNITMKQSLFIGVAQSISMIPGVSRSAATIFGGLFVGLDRKTATEFSFLLAVPTMLAATALDLKDSSFRFNSYEWLVLVLGFITSFIIAIFAVKWLIAYVQKNNFIFFGIYRIILSLLYFLLIK